MDIDNSYKESSLNLHPSQDLMNQAYKVRQESVESLAEKANTLNCKINSTNGGTFSKSAEKNLFIFSLFQGASVMSK